MNSLNIKEPLSASGQTLMQTTCYFEDDKETTRQMLTTYGVALAGNWSSPFSATDTGESIAFPECGSPSTGSSGRLLDGCLSLI